jgi:hypothetical protein
MLCMSIYPKNDCVKCIFPCFHYALISSLVLKLYLPVRNVVQLIVGQMIVSQSKCNKSMYLQNLFVKRNFASIRLYSTKYGRNVTHEAYEEFCYLEFKFVNNLEVNTENRYVENVSFRILQIWYYNTFPSLNKISTKGNLCILKLRWVDCLTFIVLTLILLIYWRHNFWNIL